MYWKWNKMKSYESFNETSYVYIKINNSLLSFHTWTIFYDAIFLSASVSFQCFLLSPSFLSLFWCLCTRMRWVASEQHVSSFLHPVSGPLWDPFTKPANKGNFYFLYISVILKMSPYYRFIHIYSFSNVLFDIMLKEVTICFLCFQIYR